MTNLELTFRIQLLRFALKPLVRFALRHSIKLQELLPVLKEQYVATAAEILKETGQERSSSRIAIMTGVHRKDVALLEAKPDAVIKSTSVIAKVIGHWQIDTRFLSKGRPKALSVTGKESEFLKLVRSVHSELNPYTILFELERMGAVCRIGEKISLVRQEFGPGKDALESFALYSLDGDRLLQAIEENSFELNEIPNLHLTTEFDNIPNSALPAIRKWFMQEGEKLHQRARTYLSSFDKDLHPKLRSAPGRNKVSIGTVSLTVPMEIINETEEKS